MLNRRNWLRQSVLATAGAALLAPSGLKALNDRQASIPEQLATPGIDEAYWEMVKSQFTFAPGLTYFNNGSLGACPNHVIQATNEFRKTLDGFPSKYMWGGWDDEKEALREKVAKNFSISPETIALIHNTRNLPELLGLGAALDFRALIGQERIEDRIFELKHYFRELLAKDDRFVLKTPEADGLSAGIQTVEVVGKKAGKVRSNLTDNHGIDCRPMSAHDINGVRISLAIYCTKADIKRLVMALAG